MKIIDVKTYATMPRQNRPWLFVEVQTDEGIKGLEAIHTEPHAVLPHPLEA